VAISEEAVVVEEDKVENNTITTIITKAITQATIEHTKAMAVQKYSKIR